MYGGKGWIGSQFIATLNKTNLTYHLGISRVDNVASLLAEIKDIQPTHIVSFIGRTHGKIGGKYYSTI